MVQFTVDKSDSGHTVSCDFHATVHKRMNIRKKKINSVFK